MESRSPVKIPINWLQEPRIKTQSELVASRRNENKPDISFDLDNDGVVGAHDLVLGSLFDKDKDGKLNEEEMKNARRALSQGYSSNFMWGCESSGLNRSFRLVQKRGLVINDEDFGKIRDTYPDTLSNTTRVWTKTLLDQQRKAQDRSESKKNEGRIYTTTKKELEMNDFLSKENYIESPRYFSISGKRALEKQQARVKVGLTSDPQDLKAEEVTFSYKEDPKNLSFSDMRQKQRLSQIQDLNSSADYSHVTFYSKVEKEKAFPSKTGKNLKDVLNERRKKDISHLEEAFTFRITGIHGKELPKFEQNIKPVKTPPFENFEKNVKTVKNLQKHEEKKEIPLKPTQVEPEAGTLEGKNMINSKFSDYYSQFMPHAGKSFESIQEKMRLAQLKIPEKKHFRFLSHNEVTPPITQRLALKATSPRYKSITSTGFIYK
jgi:hypothetical protein